MNRHYIGAAVLAALGVAVAAASVIGSSTGWLLGLIVASAALPTAVLLAVIGRLGMRIPIGALVAGGTLAVGMSVAGYALVGGTAYLVLAEFAQWLLDTVDGAVDSDLLSVLSDPWMIFIAVNVVVLAPLIEEFSKAVSARLAKPVDRRSAVLAGVAAGVGFAIVENVMYSLGGLFDAGGWETVALVRMAGSAVHPFAAGLVSLGWWELRNQDERSDSLRLISMGVGLHAIWNAAMFAVLVASAGFSGGATSLELLLVTMGYAGALGAAIAIAGWQTLNRVAAGEPPRIAVDASDASTMSAWVVVASTVLVPAIVVAQTFGAGS